MAMDMLQSINVSAGGMFAQSQRMKAAAENIANADSVQATSGQGAYRAKQVTFSSVLNRATGMTEVRAKTSDDMNSPMRTMYNPGSDLADAKGYVTMPNVNVVDEMVNMLSASRSYQTNVETMNAAKTMLLKTLTLGQ